MHFQIDEPEPSEQVRIGNLESIPAQPFRKDGCDRPETLTSALFGLDESVV